MLHINRRSSRHDGIPHSVCVNHFIIDSSGPSRDNLFLPRFFLHDNYPVFSLGDGFLFGGISHPRATSSKLQLVALTDFEKDGIPTAVVPFRLLEGEFCLLPGWAISAQAKLISCLPEGTLRGVPTLLSTLSPIPNPPLSAPILHTRKREGPRAEPYLRTLSFFFFKTPPPQ